ncbi:accessory Sec system glycosyltransferase Asp1, partial [Staphylococcus epidermidis]|uniref:accessory Sec system glycosyltransferase Asp1 n=1 Tax=Staphylococcus epidermidis TaxID=1282 RepID=UPI0034D96030
MIHIQTLPFQQHLLTLISKLTLLLHLSLHPKLFLQISSIPPPIPQINKNTTHYLKHIHNPYIIH